MATCRARCYARGRRPRLVELCQAGRSSVCYGRLGRAAFAHRLAQTTGSCSMGGAGTSPKFPQIVSRRAAHEAWPSLGSCRGSSRPQCLCCSAGSRRCGSRLGAASSATSRGTTASTLRRNGQHGAPKISVTREIGATRSAASLALALRPRHTLTKSRRTATWIRNLRASTRSSKATSTPITNTCRFVFSRFGSTSESIGLTCVIGI
mmetsp:Transcript_119791/g.339060  ORF Transcript_119791/g.339060 Transcript_119791/m.339060 type:complete len:207 (-) Transcript_119791:735-1355(-)